MKHRILNKPILSIISFYIILQIITIPISFIPNEIGGYILLLALIFLAIYLFKRNFKDEGFKGMLTKQNLKLGIILLIPFFIMEIIQFIIDGVPDLTNFSLKITSYVVIMAILEETIYRGFLISNFMRILTNEKKIIITMLTSGIIFGLTHLLNITGGASLEITIIQVISCIGSGCLWAAIFLRTGNLWIAMLGHVFNNFINSIDSKDLSTNGIITTTQLDWTCIIPIIIAIISIILAFYYIRNEKQKEIIKLWNTKWDNN